MLRRTLFVIGGFLTIGAAVFVGLITFVTYTLSRSDDYPPTLATLRHPEPRAYAQLAQNFSELVTASFPPGTNLDQAIAKLSGEGFTLITDRPGSAGFDPSAVRLTWKRHSGPCLEHYSIVLRKDDAGRVKVASGDLFPSCL